MTPVQFLHRGCGCTGGICLSLRGAGVVWMLCCRWEPKTPVCGLLHLKTSPGSTGGVLGMARVLFTLKTYFAKLWNPSSNTTTSARLHLRNFLHFHPGQPRPFVIACTKTTLAALISKTQGVSYLEWTGITRQSSLLPGFLL